MRFVWIFLGLVSLAAGVIGAALPLLPTVPFLLLAAFCFARSSPHLHAWLLHHRTLGPPIADWQRRGAISRRGKCLASGSIVLAFVLALLFGAPAWALAVQVPALVCVAAFIWTRPD